MPSAMVTFNGRITLPLHVRKELGLKTGDNVDFVEIEKGRFAIVPGAEPIDDSEAWGTKYDSVPEFEDADKSHVY
ncbi:MAG: AbrB/MazE/SpoVT family DNA-binding domain-containing protein [Terracidiphilus sp.]|jgi:AbrB family looped-hinge helix DNA binding protein